MTRLDIESLIKPRGSSSWTIRGVILRPLKEERVSLNLLMDCDRAVGKLATYHARDVWNNVHTAIRPFRYFCQGEIKVGWDAYEDTIHAKIYLNAPMSVFWEGQEVKSLNKYPEDYDFPDQRDIIMMDKL